MTLTKRFFIYIFSCCIFFISQGCSTIDVNKNASEYKPVRGQAGKDVIIWDSATNADLFCNSDFLTNIRDSGSSISFSGVGGSFETTLVGDTQYFGTVHYHPDAPANILSQPTTTLNSYPIITIIVLPLHPNLFSISMSTNWECIRIVLVLIIKLSLLLSKITCNTILRGN